MIAVPLAVEDANSKLSDILCYIRVEETVENGSVNIHKYWRASLVFEWCNQSTPHRLLKYLVSCFTLFAEQFPLTIYF